MIDLLLSSSIIMIGTFILFCVMVYCSEEEQPALALGVLTIALVAYEWTLDVPGPLTYALHNPFWLLALVACFFFFGALFMLYRFHRYCKNHPIYEQVILDYIANDEANHTRETFFKSSFHFDNHYKNHLNKLGTWLVLWPFSLFWILLKDPITWIVETVQGLSADWLQGISSSATTVKPTTAKKELN